jgi:hypothetical protein
MLAHHGDFPMIMGEGETSDRAVLALLHHLTAALDSVGSASHQGPVQQAIADVQAYLAALPQKPTRLTP